MEVHLLVINPERARVTVSSQPWHVGVTLRVDPSEEGSRSNEMVVSFEDLPKLIYMLDLFLKAHTNEQLNKS